MAEMTKWAEGRYERHIIDMDRGLRSGPGTEFQDEGKPHEPEVFKGDTVDIYPDTATKDKNGNTWCKVEVVMGRYPGKRGWMNVTGLKSFRKTITGTLPAIPKIVEMPNVEVAKVETATKIVVPPAPELSVLYVRIIRKPLRLTPSEAAALIKMGIELVVAVGPEVQS